MTAREFFTLPETMLPTELIDGELIMSPSPELNYQEIVLSLAFLLKQRLQSGKVYISPLDVHLDDENVVQPDVLWVAPDSATCKPVEGKHLRGAPDLVAEVISPGSGRRDRKNKFALYEKYGTREYWIADPAEKLIEIYGRSGDKLQRIGAYGPDEQFASPLVGSVDLKGVFLSPESSSEPDKKTE